MEALARQEGEVSSTIAALEADIDYRHHVLSEMHFSGSDFAIFKDFLTHLDASRSAYLSQQEQLRRQIDEMKLQLTEILKEIKMLETLKAKALAELKKTRNRKEQKRLDEIAIRGARG